MSSVSHDHLFEALGAIQSQLEKEDPIAAEVATARLLSMIQMTNEPAADPRLLPMFLYCQKLATALKASLDEQMQHLATSQRASQAYERDL